MMEPRLSRRSLLKLPMFLPFIAFRSTLGSREHYFQYEGVIGTSLDIVVWTSNSGLAESACGTILKEIRRLTSILDTRDPTSEIRLVEASDGGRRPSAELRDVFALYNYWRERTAGVVSIRPGGVGTPLNVDALGKAYIIDRAARSVRRTWPSIDALLLNIGGDIVTWGQPCAIGIANPAACSDNVSPDQIIRVQNAAVATSGTYARGAHLIDARSGMAPNTSAAATVVASDAVTANALSTTLCLTSAGYGLQLVESTRGAEAIRMESGILQQTSGFGLLSLRGAIRQAPPPTAWPQGYRMTLTLPLKAGRSTKRPYVAVWIEDFAGKLVRTLAVWGNKEKYFAELSTAWGLLLKENQNQLRSVTRATRPAGRYELTWDGLDNDHRPVPLGNYRIVVETNQEHGTYAKQAGTISLSDHPASITLPATANFDAVLVQYGPA